MPKPYDPLEHPPAEYSIYEFILVTKQLLDDFARMALNTKMATKRQSWLGWMRDLNTWASW